MKSKRRAPEGSHMRRFTSELYTNISYVRTERSRLDAAEGSHTRQFSSELYTNISYVRTV
jgi:hypothetical protein